MNSRPDEGSLGTRLPLVHAHSAHNIIVSRAYVRIRVLHVPVLVLVHVHVDLVTLIGYGVVAIVMSAVSSDLLYLPIESS